MDRLSAREFEIAERYVLGETKKEVANSLRISLYTVCTTLKNVYTTLGINRAVDLTLLYCGYTFNIAKDISLKQKEKLPILFVLIALSLGSVKQESFRTRSNPRSITQSSNRVRSRTRRREFPIPLERFENSIT